VSKILSQFFTSFLITSFLAAAFFCSCAGSAENSLGLIGHHDDADCCDSPQGKTNHSSEKHCDCFAAKVVNADITSKAVLTVPGSSSQQSFIFNNFIFNKVINVKSNLSYTHGPPGPIVTIPLYFQFHSLRI
jgi:hypothetical protein